MLDNRKTFHVSPLMGLVMTVLFFVMIYLAIKGLYYVASILVPVLAIATLIIDYTVYIDQVKFITNSFKRDTLTGIIITALHVMLLPFVVLFLFSKSLFRKFVMKKLKENPMFNQQQKSEDDYVEYEEVEEEEVPFIELPPVREKPPKRDNSYDDFFK